MREVFIIVLVLFLFSCVNSESNEKIEEAFKGIEFSDIPEIAKWQSNRIIKSTNQIGVLILPLGGNVRYFETMPGGKGKPRKLTGVKKGVISVYETFNWKEIDSNLEGCHLWCRVSTNEEWMFAQEISNYIPQREDEKL